MGCGTHTTCNPVKVVGHTSAPATRSNTGDSAKARLDGPISGQSNTAQSPLGPQAQHRSGQTYTTNNAQDPSILLNSTGARYYLSSA